MSLGFAIVTLGGGGLRCFRHFMVSGTVVFGDADGAPRLCDNDSRWLLGWWGIEREFRTESRYMKERGSPRKVRWERFKTQVTLSGDPECYTRIDQHKSQLTVELRSEDGSEDPQTAGEHAVGERFVPSLPIEFRGTAYITLVCMLSPELPDCGRHGHRRNTPGTPGTG